MKRQSALRNDQERDVSDENPYGQTASEAAFLYIRNYEEHANEHDCSVAAVTKWNCLSRCSVVVGFLSPLKGRGQSQNGHSYAKGARKGEGN